MSHRGKETREGDIRERSRGIDLLALAIEVNVAHAVRVVVAAVGVAETGVALLGVGTTAALTDTILADVVLVVLAGVGGQGKGVLVGLPDVNLGAARAELANTSRVITGGRLPALVVGLFCFLFMVSN
jgi:hypothetical protein